MQYGLYIPNYGAESSARGYAELAYEAEQCGWDGFFLWDHLLLSKSQKLNIIDPWIALTAVAMRTEKLCFGTTVTPLARYKPWSLARQTAALDQLSGGRLILSVGLGVPEDVEYGFFGEDTSPRVHAEKLDEGLDILSGLWKGKPFRYEGKHYRLEKMTFLPTPVQQPRIPIWVGGFWNHKKPFQRAARWDGVIPLRAGGGGFWMLPDDIRDMLEFITPLRKGKVPFDVVLINNRHAKLKGKLAGAEKVAAYAEVGVTWWLEALYLQRDSMDEMRRAIRLGPPK